MQSMDEIYQKHAQMVYKYLMSLSRDEDAAQELTQETFYQAIRSSGKYDGSCKISTWLCAIAKNVFLTWQRKKRRITSLSEQVQRTPEHVSEEDSAQETGLTSPSAESVVMESAERVDVFRLIHALEEPYKEVMYLRIFGGLSFREIGDIHAKTENWARVTYYRGREKLRKIAERKREENE